MRIALADDIDTINITTQGDVPVVTLFFHRIGEKISNTTVILHARATFENVVPTVVHIMPCPKPAIVRRT